MYVYVHLNSNWIIYSYGGIFRLGNDFLNLSQVESSRIISRWGCASNSTILPDSATHAPTDAGWRKLHSDGYIIVALWPASVASFSARAEGLRPCPRA